MLPYFSDFIQNFDINLLNGIQETFKCAFLDHVMPVITALGNTGILWIIIAIIMLFFKKTRKTGAMMCVALILGLIFGNGILKNVLARVRPYELENALVTNPVIDKPHDWSFPSGHTLASFEAATVLLIRDKRYGIPALVIAILIAFSRLYLYVHFPSDVFGGIILGVIFGFLGVWIVNTIWDHFIDKKIKA